MVGFRNAIFRNREGIASKSLGLPGGHLAFDVQVETMNSHEPSHHRFHSTTDPAV